MENHMIKSIYITIWILVTGLTFLVLPCSSISNGQQIKEIQESTYTHNTKTTTSKKNRIAIPIDVPIYKPPSRGAPKALVGGGSRGTGTGSSTLSLIAPDHAGLTVQKQPLLYWYLSELPRDSIEFTLIDNQAIQPLLEISLGTQIEPGLHHTSLADYKISLISGKQYWWFVALVPDPEHRSKDIIAGAAIEYIEPPETLTTKLTLAGKVRAPHIYAESGIWYDAISSISNLINNSPDDMTLRKQRASLMEQVGLQEVTKYEIKSGITTEREVISSE